MFSKLTAFKRDLNAAGIPFINENGERFDLHAMRKTLCTRMAIENVPTRIAMKAMRHSEERLTTKVYTDQSRLPVAAHINALPPLLQSHVSPGVSLKGAPEGNGAPQRDTVRRKVNSGQGAHNQPIGHALTHTDTFRESVENGSGGRARTYDLVVNSHPLYH